VPLTSATPATVAAMSQAFAAVIAPLSTAPATRVKAGHNWHLTWALARGTLPLLLPMNTDVLLAMLWAFLAMGASKSTLGPRAVPRYRWPGLLPPDPVPGPVPWETTSPQDGQSITRDMVVDLLR
jgi:hypothetical protein